MYLHQSQKPRSRRGHVTPVAVVGSVFVLSRSKQYSTDMQDKMALDAVRSCVRERTKHCSSAKKRRRGIAPLGSIAASEVLHNRGRSCPSTRLALRNTRIYAGMTSQPRLRTSENSSTISTLS